MLFPCLRAAPWFCWCSRLASLAQSSLGPAQYRRWAFIQHCIFELIIANLLLPYIANPAPHISTPCIRTLPWQSLYSIFGVTWHRWLPITACCMVRTCKTLIFALLWAFYHHILVVIGTLFLGFVSCSTNHDRIQSQFMGFVDRGRRATTFANTTTVTRGAQTSRCTWLG